MKRYKKEDYCGIFAMRGDVNQKFPNPEDAPVEFAYEVSRIITSP